VTVTGEVPARNNHRTRILVNAQTYQAKVIEVQRLFSSSPATPSNGRIGISERLDELHMRHSRSPGRCYAAIKQARSLRSLWGAKMKRLFSVFLGALILGLSSAHAASPFVATPEAFAWNGLYFGMNGGGAWGQSRWSAGHLTTGDFDVSGGLGGVTVGHNFQTGSWVWGLEGTSIGWASTAPPNPTARPAARRAAICSQPPAPDSALPPTAS